MHPQYPSNAPKTTKDKPPPEGEPGKHRCVWQKRLAKGVMRRPLHGLPITVLGELVARTRLREQGPQLLHPTSSSRDETQHAKPLKPAGKRLASPCYFTKQ